MESKDLTIDVSTFCTINELRERNAKIDEVIAVVKQCYASKYKRVTFTYQGSSYLVEENKVYI